MAAVRGLAALAWVLTLACGGCSSVDQTSSSSSHHHDGQGGHQHGHHHGPSHDHAHHDTAAGAGLDHSVPHPSHDPSAPCACASAIEHHGWCPKCNVGYVAGRRIESARLFETLDPHGHETMLESLKCPTCRAARASDGFCDDCRMGFVDQKAYFTRLTHGLAQGHVVDPATLACAACRANAAGSGWCDACARGMVGNVAIADRRVFDRTAGEFAILQAAIKRAPACEWCAAAMVVHRTCLECRISYESGAVSQSTRGGSVQSPPHP